MSTTNALDRNMIEAQLGSVVVLTSISPGLTEMLVERPIRSRPRYPR